MAAITPKFIGVYDGHMIYNAINFTVGDTLKKYVESMDIVYDSIYDRKLLGFSDSKYLLNATNATKSSGEISLGLVGDLPDWLMCQLIQLAKACNGGGMTLTLSDTWMTNKTYDAKWENAGDFVENNALLCGGSMNFRFYKVT